ELHSCGPPEFSRTDELEKEEYTDKSVDRNVIDEKTGETHVAEQHQQQAGGGSEFQEKFPQEGGEYGLICRSGEDLENAVPKDKKRHRDHEVKVFPELGGPHFIELQQGLAQRYEHDGKDPEYDQ